MTTSAQLRRYPRYRCDRHLRLFLDHGATLDGWATDISLCGVGAVVAERVHPGEKVRLEMAGIPGKGNLILDAVVRRREGAMHGLELVDVSAVQQGMIKQICMQA